jgi:hypothetical protein
MALHATADDLAFEHVDGGEQRFCNGHRDATMMLLAFRHGLRAAELVALRWDSTGQAACEPGQERLAVRASLAGTEIRSLRPLKRESLESSFVFTSELTLGRRRS